MKKVVVIITVIIFIASIAVVNILGGEFLTLEGAVYPTQIEIDEVRVMDGGDNGLGTTISLKKEETSNLGNSYFYEFYYDKTEFDNGNYPVIRFTYHVYPEDATNKKVIITPDSSQQEKGYSEFNGDLCQITIKKQFRDVKYVVYAEHQPNVMIFLYVTCKSYN
ncbi:MAG: hypothetical protein J6R29_06310 [Clostridia bacterium]|nr:hypothetical protein [Clostridia bacterium]